MADDPDRLISQHHKEVTIPSVYGDGFEAPVEVLVNIYANGDVGLALRPDDVEDWGVEYEMDKREVP